MMLGRRLLLLICGLGLVSAARLAWADAPSAAGGKKPPRLAENLRPFDTNGDGKLDAAERKAYNASKKKDGATAATPADSSSLRCCART